MVSPALARRAMICLPRDGAQVEGVQGWPIAHIT